VRTAVLPVIIFLGVLPAASETLTLEASRDATLIEDPDGSLANGAGPVFFVGHTAQSENGIRRALLSFDVAAALPRGAIIESVSLRLFMTPSNPEPRPIRLHRVLADWGEGPSARSGGGGATALPGDVTWLHTFWDYDFWVQSGGQFLGRASAALVVAGPGYYSWSDVPHLAQDVRLWNEAPARNFGWILTGDETTRQSSKSFASREHPDPALRPILVITYRTAGAPQEP
jgi:hypothetical protein